MLEYKIIKKEYYNQNNELINTKYYIKQKFKFLFITFWSYLGDYDFHYHLTMFTPTYFDSEEKARIFIKDLLKNQSIKTIKTELKYE